ncbi:MAG: Do family serine endopeptidase [Candidatus Marinimicrobia bacterium]|nr:Do family serine endopeptidase [Candidatus Neomarinimicrobiota bacterium]MDP6568685.1 Do family serine endopeptidase [Candidatus Neomarinimicrobiota bacterium]
MKRIMLPVMVLVFLSTLSAKLPAAKELSDTFVSVVEKVNAAVVTITSEKVFTQGDSNFRHPFDEYFGDNYFPYQYRDPNREYRSQILGSGVIVDAVNGYILTNNHVVAEADEIIILLIDEREYEADVIGRDPQSDLAVLKIDAEDLVAAELGDSDELDVGEWVLAIGSPFSEELSHTVTAGIVSAKGRSRIIDGTSYEDFIQTDAAINPGNSGGALVDLDGKLVGINTAIATGGFSRGNVGVGFTIPINLASRIMNALIADGKVIRSWLGVYIQDVDDGIARALGLEDRQGVIVTRIVEGSPAEGGGVEVEDIIVEFDGTKIRDAAHLKNTVSSTSPGSKSVVKVIRNKRKKTLRVNLVELPQDVTVFASSQSSGRSLGIEAQELTAEWRRRLRLDEDVQGVVVTDVSSRSAAGKAEIKAGDLIKRIGDTEIRDMNDFRSAVSVIEEGEAVLFLILRQGYARFITVENN